MRTISLLALLSSCEGGSRVEVVVPPEDERAFTAFLDGIGDERLVLRVASDPLLEQRQGGWSIAVLPDGSCAECYIVTADRRRVAVGGGGLLGRQYGVADVLEQLGYRFHHPLHTVVPDRLGALDPERLGVPHVPEVARRGIHLHTLHPIEGLYDFWLPSQDGLARAERVIDWVVKNRGNHLQWVSLDDIMRPDVYGPWHDHTAAIHRAAHARGLTVGVGVQLFGSGNLQNAFDLLDRVGTPEEQRAEIARRGEILMGGDLDWDLVNLSFGEFFAEEPESFLASTNLAVAELLAIEPDAELASVIHVGKDLVVEYDDQELLYYFLATYADERLVPWVHTVMYFNLFEPALGAYHHDAFDEHRDLLLDRMGAGEPVGYFPESAYWVAFDNPIPVFLPLYVRSRWLDLHMAREATGADLPAHVVFSSGWEWGYWQTDVATLRMSYALPDTPGELYVDMFAPWDDGEVVAALLDDTMATQHRWLLEEGLSAWIMGIDAVMELGYQLDIVSQPRRPSFEDVAADPAAYADTLADLAAMATDFRGLADRAAALDTSDPWMREIADGLEVTALRAAFAHRVHAAVATPEEAEAHLAEAGALRDAAEVVVRRRHRNFHDPLSERLVEEGDNPTVYPYGYLIRADELCFWERELVQARNVVEGTSEPAPGCAL